METPSPAFVVDEAALRRNFSLIREVALRSGVEIVLSLKAFSLWRIFGLLQEYGIGASASGAYEARLAEEELGVLAHTYSPAFTEDTFPEVLAYSDKVTFNSLSQYEMLYPLTRKCDHRVSLGLRVNPEYSEIKTPLYNPCTPGSRFGVLSDQMPASLPRGIEGFLCHTHCESQADELVRTLVHLENKFGRYLPQLRWLNLGGGHLMTREGYDVDLLVNTLLDLRERYPRLHVILEPGSAYAWQTGKLVATIVDIVENHGIRTAMLDVSFTCHMPDCLEMPYQPTVRGAEALPPDYCTLHPEENRIYRLGGNSCLSGDFMGCWRFDHRLFVGEHVIFEDMNHYTTVKTTMFNGVPHPPILVSRVDGELETLRLFTYEDYKNRMC